MKTKFFEAARAVAHASEGVGPKNNFKHGAVLVRKNKVIASACNILKTHPALAEFTEFPYLHAETRAIFRQGLKNCVGLDLYVIRLDREGEFAMSKPCPTCRQVIKKSGIKNVFYTDDYSNFNKL